MLRRAGSTRRVGRPAKQDSVDGAAAPAAYDLNDYTEQYVKVGSNVVPWYLAPFEYTIGGETQTYDFFEEDRALYLEWRKSKNVDLFWEMWQRNFAFACHNGLYIRDKQAKTVLFNHWNLLQRRLWWAFCIQWYSHKPVRLLILKARQLGASTWSEALLFWAASTRTEQVAFIIGDKDTVAKRVYGMTERFFNNLSKTLPETCIPQRQNHSGEMLVFAEDRRTSRSEKSEKKRNRKGRITRDDEGNPVDEERDGSLTPSPKGPILGSSIEVMTARTNQFEHGFTASLVHATEIATWPNPDEMWREMEPGIPNEEGTIVIMESVAKCAGDFWNAQWDIAVAGKSRYLPVFCGWNLAPWKWSSTANEGAGGWTREYSSDLPPAYCHRDPEINKQRREQFVHTFDDEEAEISTTYGLSLEQIQWRRETIKDKNDNDQVEDFKRQYPINAPEAFRNAGKNVFDQKAVDAYMEFTDPTKHAPPVFKGDLEIDDKGLVKLVASASGYTRIWAMPVPGRTYVIGADPAESEGDAADFCSGQVLDSRTLEQVAHCWCRKGSKYFASQVFALARLYGNALVIPECQGLGYKLTGHLSPEGEYPVQNLYVAMETTNVEGIVKNYYGHSTNRKTKPVLVDKLRQVVNGRMVVLHDYETVKQMRGFVRRDDGSFGAANPKTHDDAVMGLGLAMVGIDSGQILEPFDLEGYSLSDPTDQMRSLKYDDEIAMLGDWSRPMGGAFHSVLGECV